MESLSGTVHGHYCTMKHVPVHFCILLRCGWGEREREGERGGGRERGERERERERERENSGFFQRGWGDSGGGGWGREVSGVVGGKELTF